MISRLTSITMFAIFLAFAPELNAEQESDDSVEAARARFSRGVELADQGSFQEALEIFRELERTHPHPVVLYNIGWCLSGLERYAEAIDVFEAYLEAADDDSEENRIEARGELARLRVLTGRTEDEPEPSEEEVRSPIDDDEPSQGRRRLSPGWFWASLGLTLATAAAMTGTGAASLSLSNQWQETWQQEDRDRGEPLVSVTNGLLIAMAFEAALTLVLGLFTDFRGSGPENSVETDEP